MPAIGQSAPVVFAFVDTEFTSLERPELLSIGISASDGTELYCERNDYRPEDCSDFVRSEVLPKLGYSWHVQASLGELAARTEAWFASRADSAVVLAYDYVDDVRLTLDLLTPEVRAAVLPLDVRWDMSEDLLQEFFSKPAVLRHHALHDARALASACGPWMSKTIQSLELVMQRLAHLSVAGRLTFLRTERPELGGAHPIQAINEGRLASVQELAAAYA